MRDMVVFGEDFGGLPSSTQHLVKYLAKDRQVIWVNSIGLRQPRFNLHDCKRAASKLLGHGKQGFDRFEDTPTNISVVNLRTIPAPQSGLSRQMAKQMMLSQLKPILKNHNIHKPILWSSLPTAADLVGHLDEHAVVYYCGDDFSALSGVDHNTVARHEEELVKKANIIFGASENLCAKFPNCKTQLLPHGVDVDLFTTPTQPANDLPKSGKPIAGFYGSLSTWIDYELIHYVAINLPNWEFVFIGPNELNHYPLPRLDNVHYLGPKPHHQLPSYSQHWQASLLPFKANNQINACNPLKLLEYLAVGAPVISTPFPALQPYSKYINIVETAHEMSGALKLATYEPRLPSDIVTQDSWQCRGEFVKRMLDQL
ncbi:glycosyltransferase family 1 protein [Vibrio sp. LaRot3]|uniref:glycosyltransferase family 1 protein n=1 Tax=Vibrio sp. LaRot3 TaxID=2998829 RepID=UPI0022CDD9F8|nr:glycosyltransferase family 1 protein [Vibrio sp. LaRot3]MDA0147613.1 glycosyltransferase family 1 protein [Vibrio sp. LaRot3]